MVFICFTVFKASSCLWKIGCRGIVSFLQATRLPNGENIRRRPTASSILPEMSSLPYQPSTRWLRIRSRRSKWTILLHTALPTAGEIAATDSSTVRSAHKTGNRCWSTFRDRCQVSNSHRPSDHASSNLRSRSP